MNSRSPDDGGNGDDVSEQRLGNGIGNENGNASNPKKQKRNNTPDFKHVLYECGVSSLLPNNNSNNNINNNNNNNMDQHKQGSILEPNVNPASLRVSIDGLLKEMHSNGIDVDNALVLDSMESLIMNGEYCSHDTSSSHSGGTTSTSGSNKKGRTFELLWRMLLPIVVVQVTNKKNDSIEVTNDNGNGNGNGDTNKDSSTFTSSSSSSSSLMKILLRIDVLQSTLITCLFSKLQELATMDQDDDDDDDDDDENDKNEDENENDENDNKEGKNKSTSTTKATTALDIDYFTIIQEVPRLILSHIRWMDHIVQPKVLTQAALECLTMLCTMSGSTISDDGDIDGGDDDGDDNDDNSNSNGNGNKNNKNGNRNGNNRTKNDPNNTDNNTICKSILLDLIATLPDIIADETTAFDSTVIGNANSREDNEEEEEEEDTMTTILSTLRDVRIQDPTLLIPCLDAVSSLRLSTQDQMDSVIYDALEAIESVEESWLLPALCKFLMQNVPRGGSGGVFGGGGGGSGGSGSGGTKGSDLCQKVIDSFRRLRLGKENVIDNDEDMDGLEYRNQIQCNSDSEALMIEALSQGFAYRSDLTNILLQSIKNVLSGSITTSTADQLQHEQHGPSDIWLLLCCAQAPHNKPKVKAIFKSKAISGAFYPDLIKDSIQGNTIAIQSLFESSLLFIADALVRSNETSAQKLGSAFYETMFLEFDNRICRQDLIGQMIIHINSGSYEEVDVAMKVLMNIASSGVDGVASLRIFLPFLTSLLDNIRNFHPQHLRRLFLLLFIVGMDGSCGSEDVDSEMEGFGGGCDDVHIVIRKYLALPQIAMKHIGIIGAVCFAAACPNNSTDPIIRKDIVLMLDMVHKNCEGKEEWHSSMNHGNEFSATTLGTSAMTMFYDELCLALKGTSLAPFIKEWIQCRFASRLEELYLADLNIDDNNTEEQPKSEVDLIIDKEDIALVKGTSDNPRAPLGDLRYNFDKEDCTVYLKLLSLYASDKAFEREILPQQLCPLLRLLAACYDERFGGEGLSEIDALIGCPILLPNESCTGINFNDLPLEKKWTTTASIFTAVNWCRELINCFAHSAAFRTMDKEETQLTQLQEENRCKVTEKLRALVVLEEELQFCAANCYSFAPSGLEILHIPKEVIDLQNQKGTYSNTEEYDDDNDNDDEILLTKMTAEERKAIAEVKKLRKRKVSARMRSKQKALKLRAKHESQLAKIAKSALIPFNIDVCLALGFPELRLTNSMQTSSQDLMASLGASELRNLKVGGHLTNLLLDQLNKSLKTLFVSKSKHSPFFKKQTQRHEPEISSDTKDNPYDSAILKINKEKDSRSTKSVYAFLNACISQGVFISIHEHLAAIAEIRGNASSSDEEHDEEQIIDCARLLLRCITTLFEAKDLSNLSLGRAYLEMIVKQLSDGEQIHLQMQKPASSIPSLLKYVMSLFDLLEEIVIGGETNDLSFVMEGITCLKMVLLQISTVVKRVGEEQNQNKSIQNMKLKISKLCLRLLQREWHSNTNFNKGNVGLLVSMHLEYASVPFKALSKEENFRAKNFGRVDALTTMVNTLKELSTTHGCKGPLESYPTCNLATFGYYLSSILSILSKELIYLFQSPMAQSCNHMQECLNVLQFLVSLLKQTSELTKENPELAKKGHLLMQLKGGSKFVEVFVKYAFPFLGNSFGNHQEFVLNIIKDTQSITRQLGYISSHGKRVKDANLVKETPKVKKSCEMFVHHMRSIMRKNGVLDALYGGNLRNRNIDGTLSAERFNGDESGDSGDNNSSDDCSEGTDTESDNESDEES